MRLLGERGGEAADENSAAALLTMIWQKIRQSTGGNHLPSNVVNDDTVPPYAHESTTYFIDGQCHHLKEPYLHLVPFS